MYKEKIKEYQKKTGKTWTAIAGELGISYRRLRYILTTKTPSKAVLKLIDMVCK